MKLQKINGHQSFGMAHEIDDRGMTPVEKAAIDAVDIPNAFRDVRDTVIVSKVYRDKGDLYYPAAAYANKLEGKGNYTAHYAFEVVHNRFLYLARCLLRLQIDAVVSDSTTGLKEDGIKRVLASAITNAKILCRQETPGVMTRVARAFSR